MNVVIKTVEKQKALRTTNNAWQTILSFSVPMSQVVEVYADILAQRVDKSGRASFKAEGLFFRNDDSEDLVEKDGSVNKPKIGGLSVDVDIVVTNIDAPRLRQIDIKVQGQADEAVVWDCAATFRTRAQATNYSGYPRMQISIVGMRENKKLGWNGLTDGINHVLTATDYRFASVLTGTNRYKMERWGITSYKTLGTVSGTDMVGANVYIAGNSTTWTRQDSITFFAWLTYTGLSGTGVPTRFNNYLTRKHYTTNVSGYLKKRVLCGSISVLGVSFVWSRHDPLGWVNYPA